MVNSLDISGQELKARFVQRSRSMLPFNPVDVTEITGANVERLQKTMRSFGWLDARFITKAQAAENGWTFKPRSEIVEIHVRNEVTGSLDIVSLVNGENVRGMPPLSAMLSLSDADFLKMHGINPTTPSLDAEEELSIGPARTVYREIEPNSSGSSVLNGSGDSLNTELIADKATQELRPEKGPAAPNSDLKSKPTQLRPGFKTLTAHGVAPYLRDPNNKASYFVSLNDEKGDVKTIWGVDLERSLSDAGVQIGDGISIIQNGHRTVEIDEKQADGSFVKRPVNRINWDTSIQSISVEQPLKSHSHGLEQGPLNADASSAAIEGNLAIDRFAAMAPYWLDGLHNAEGLALAKKINFEIKARGLAEDRESIARLMAIHSKARALGISVVPEIQQLNDPDLKRNRAEPVTLINGALVRDKEGAYRPKAGGQSVIQDQGDSVVLKNKSVEAYRGAMELAVAKGWKTIELKGKPAMLSEAWVEATLLGLEVVGYAPNEKDHAKFAARVAEESRLKESVHMRPHVQAPESVEVRPFIDGSGQVKLAAMTYTVSYQGGEDAKFGNAMDAATAFSGLSSAAMPVVVRSVIRADGVVTEGVIAGVAQTINKGGVAQVSEKILDQEFDDAMDVIVANEHAQSSLVPSHVKAVTSGQYFGPIVAIEGDRIAQKTGRQVVWHDLATLKGLVPKIGEMAEIGYAKDLGVIKEKTQETELEGGGRELER